MFKAHRLLYHSTLGLRIIEKKRWDLRGLDWTSPRTWGKAVGLPQGGKAGSLICKYHDHHTPTRKMSPDVRALTACDHPRGRFQASTEDSDWSRADQAVLKKHQDRGSYLDQAGRNLNIKPFYV